MSQVLQKARIVLTFTLLMIAALVAGPSIAMAQATADAEVTSEPVTMVLMVSDARNQADVGAGTEATSVEEGKTDVMVVLHLDPNQQACRALNLLPTTRVTIEGVGNTRLNQVMSQRGVDMTVDVIEDYLGIPVNHYGVISLDGVISAIDAIGGITVNNPEAFTIGTNEFPAGEITLSGEQAVLYARGGGEQDVQGRLDQQKALVEGLISTISGANALDAVPASVQGSMTDIQNEILTDITLDEALAVADAYSNCVPDEQTVETIMFTEEGPLFDDATQQEEVSGATDPADVQAHVDWLINGGPVPGQ